MRLFVAVTPPPEALEEVGDALAPYRREWSRLRWIPRDRQHVTLSFLGDVDEDRREALTARLDSVSCDHCPPRLHFAGAGAFPRAGRARVLWVGLSGDRDPLAALAASVAAAARQSGIDQEDRAFSPHLTLARLRAPGDLRSLVESLSGFTGTPWTADAIHLVRSHLGPNPRYETLASWALRGAP